MCTVHDGEPKLGRLPRLRKSQIKGLVIPLTHAFAGVSTRAYLPSPALGEGGHRSLARRLEAVRRRTVAVMPVGERLHPRRALWRGDHLHDPAECMPGF